jgi:N-acetylneuraminic acid mutarotase
MRPSTRASAAAAVGIAFGCGARSGLLRDSGSSSDSGAECESTCAAEGSVDAGAAIVLFGGTGSKVLRDTWIWTGSRWTPQDITGPGARWSAAVATLNGKAVLFGGAGDEGSDYDHELADTWTYDGTKWTRRSASGPSPRESAAMATLNGTVVLFGGYDPSAGDAVSTLYDGDTWTWDGTTWKELTVVGPSARASSAMAALNGAIVLFGGVNGAGDTWLGDTWTWDGARWTRQDVTGPMARQAAAMATLNDSVVLFGGLGATGYLGDTWTWDGTRWTQLDVSGPGPRGLAAMATLNESIVLFGGFDRSEGDVADTWTFDGNTWAHLNVSGPSARDSAAIASLGPR